MAGTEALQRANSLYVDHEFKEALAAYTEAIAAEPENAGLLSARAQTNIMLEDWLAAAEDAGRATQLDPSNAKAQFRKGKALYNLDEFESAKEAFEASLTRDPTNKTCAGYISKCAVQLEGEAMKVSGTFIEDITPAAKPAVAASSLPRQPSPAAVPAQPEQPSQPQPRPSKYRYEWLQMQQHIEIAIFAKKLTKDRVSVAIGKQQLDVVIRDAEQGNQEYEMSVQLYSPVDPQGSRWELLSTKLELRLKKADLSVKWPTLEASNIRPAANWSLETEPPGRAYPSSSKITKDWNKLEAELKEEEKKEVLDGDAGVQKLFRDIYGGADEETRRAMNKSFQESNGTALSTNWKEVGAKSMFKPPEDADVKKFEY